MSEQLLDFGGLVAGPGLLAAWEVFNERSESLKAKAAEPPEAEAEPAAVVEIEPVAVVENEPAAVVEIAPKAPVPGKVAALGESFLGWDEDDEEEKTVLFTLADILGPEDTESVLIDEK